MSERPLIVHVIHQLAIGGMENGLVNLINRLPRTHYRHAIWCIEDYSEFRDRIDNPEVTVEALHRGQSGVWALRRKLFRMFRQHQPALLHTRGLSGLDALLPARLAGVRHCIHGEHGRDVDDLNGENRKLALLRRLHRPLVTRYLAVSKDLASYLKRSIGVSADRIEQIYNGVDTDAFAPGPRPDALLTDGLPADGRLVVGTVGRASSVKDQATLLHACAALRQRHPRLADRLCVAVVGDGPELPGLRALAQTLGITDQTWLPGARNDIADVLRVFDVFALPSLAEGISNTILEAMATGLPVLATRVGGNVELVEEDRCGAFFEPGDSEHLAALIARYLEEADTRQAHAKAARERAVSAFSLARMVNDYDQVYRRLLQLRN